ncbi:MAG: hypothetical protein GY874_14305 [Desulfobacteraceae bacterium]|nr:hypothetical protein [Desulfobacteraceae bacterium]
MRSFTKQVSFFPVTGEKSSGKKTADSNVSPEQLAKINAFAIEPLTEDQVYVRKFIMCHNGVDRDRERFDDSLLDDFAKSFPGKSFLFAHDRRNYLPLGLFFDAATKTMSAEQFTSISAEKIQLPAGSDQAKVLLTWMYMLKNEENKHYVANFNAGIYRHVSIGFCASDWVPVKGDYKETLYHEYKGPGEALEGSLVWLGAQPGATAQKQAKFKQHGDDKNMSLHLKIGAVLGKSFDDKATDGEVAASVKDVLKAKHDTIAELTKQVSEAKQMFELGKQYVESLTAEYVRMKAALKECDETPEAQQKLKSFATTMGPEFLINENKHLEKRMAEKFPGAQLDGDMRRDKSADGNESANPLIPKD